MAGIIAYGAYIPSARLQRSAVTASLGTGGGKGARAVAGFDEDTTSMGVEAARLALRSAPEGVQLHQLLFATAAPAYLDKTNATAIHAALGLDSAVAAYDMVGSVRSGFGAMSAASQSPATTLVVVSDVRTGLPGGMDESAGGDAAVAVVFGSGAPAVADFLGAASSTAEFLDRWRIPGEPSDGVWEERFGETAYLPLAEAAMTEALKRAGTTAEGIDHLVVTGLHGRAVRSVAKAVGARPEALAPDLTDRIGNAGTAHPALLLADVLDRAEPGQVIAWMTLADGADVVVLRTTEALTRARPSVSVADQLGGGAEVPYATFLTWRGMLRREPPRRPDPERPAAPPSFRRDDWKFGFAGSRCTALVPGASGGECGTRHLPPQRVCARCDAVDQMVVERLADVAGTVATYTVDRLAFSLNPPVVAAVIDFDGGGRFACELTDVDPASVRIGDRVQMTFRRMYTAAGVHNYFWKAKPLQGEEDHGE